MDFVIALAIVCVASMVVLIVFSKFVWGKSYASAKVDNVTEYIKKLKEEYPITDPRLLTYGLAVLAFAVFLFLSHGYWHMEVSVAALMGAAVLLTIAIVTDKVNLIELIEVRGIGRKKALTLGRYGIKKIKDLVDKKNEVVVKNILKPKLYKDVISIYREGKVILQF
jgi:hypothetical protein